MKKTAGSSCFPPFFHPSSLSPKPLNKANFLGSKSRLSFRTAYLRGSVGTFRETHMSDISLTLGKKYIDLNEKLVATVAKSGWKFDSILCPLSRALRRGDFSRVYDMPLAVADELLPRSRGTVQSDLDISDCITRLRTQGPRPLLHDMVDLVRPICEVIEHLKQALPGSPRSALPAPLEQGPLRPRPDRHARTPREILLQPFEWAKLHPAEAKGSRQRRLRTGRGVTFESFSLSQTRLALSYTHQSAKPFSELSRKRLLN